MKQVITGADHIFGPWLMEKLDGDWYPGKGRTIGLLDTRGQIAAVCLYEGSNGASIMLHCAGEGRHWLNRDFLWYVFHYPFVELGVKKIISPVESSNTRCRKFIEHIGFIVEATLTDASLTGDLLVYTMSKDQCKWLGLGKKLYGQAQSTSST